MNKFDQANTPDEIIDIVDENDQIIGEATKDDAFKNPDLIHRAVSILIHDENDRVLIQQRSTNKEVYPGVWAMSAAGHVPKGVNPDDAALKELKEELGISTELKLIRKELREYPWETHITYIYKGEIPSTTKISFNEGEVQEVLFVDFMEYKSLEKNGERISKYSDEIFREHFSGKLK